MTVELTLPRATCESEARVVLATDFGAVSGAEEGLHEQGETMCGVWAKGKSLVA